MEGFFEQGPGIGLSCGTWTLEVAEFASKAGAFIRWVCFIGIGVGKVCALCSGLLPRGGRH